jgi:hypothetical protein
MIGWAGKIICVHTEVSEATFDGNVVTTGWASDKPLDTVLSLQEKK